MLSIHIFQWVVVCNWNLQTGFV